MTGPALNFPAWARKRARIRFAKQLALHVAAGALAAFVMWEIMGALVQP